MFLCPNCHDPLINAKNENGIFWACGRCGGRAATLAFLRKTILGEAVNQMWSFARTKKGEQKRLCPACRSAMVEVPVSTTEITLKLDVCTRCQIVWFDSKEYEQLPSLPPQAEGEPELSPEARRTLALHKVQLLTERAAAEGVGQAPEEKWKMLPAILGMPVECEASTFERTPWMTWTLTAAIIVISVTAFFDLRVAIADFALIPGQAWRYGGLTFLSSFFLHGNVLHLVGNVYFLWVFGDNVEDYFGHLPFVILILMATLAGGMLHVLVDPRQEVPCIGASGGISGLIAFYALKFPHARLGFLARWYWHFRWFRMPAYVALIIWLLFQLVGAWQQIAGNTYVSALAHLGGAAVGFVFWALWRKE